MKKLAAVVVAASALVGCSVSAPSTANQPLIAPPASALSAPTYQVLVEDSSEHKKKFEEFMKQLALSEDQKTQLKSIVKNALERAKPLQAELKPLITAPTIDRSALSTAVQNAMKADAAQDAQTLEEVRETLSPEQRTLIADKLTEMSTREEDPHTKMFEKLMDKAGMQITMTESQKTAFSNLKTAFMDFWKTNRAAYYTAMAMHMKEGDQAKLQAEFERLNAGVPSEAMIDFMANLDQSQRQKLVAWKEGLMQKIANKL
jgi:uncharacterized membrane protein